MPWNTFGAAMLDIREMLGRIEERLTHNTDRLNSIEDRLHKVEIREPFRPADLLPWLYGVLILGSVLLGKMSVLDALGLIRSQH